MQANTKTATSTAVNSSVQAHVLDSLFGYPPSEAFICPSNSCSWGTASTSGMCSTCTNITSSTATVCSRNHQNLDCNYTTPTGYLLQTHALDTDVYTSINTTTSYWGRSTAPLFIGFASLVWDGILNGTPPSITECELSWCVKTYRDATSLNGVFSATVEEHSLEYVYPWNTSSTRVPVYWDVLRIKGNDSIKGGNSTYTIHSSNWESSGAFLDEMLSSGVSNGYSQTMEGSTGSGFTFNLGNLMLNNPTVSDMGDSLARGLTNIIRNMSTTYTDQFPGVSYVQVQYIHVRWLWLIFPASIVLLGLLLLVFTTVQSHLTGTEIWKISALALLFHPLHGWSDEDLNKDSRREMVESAKSMRGQLVYTEHAGYRMVRRSVLSNRSLNV